MDHSYLSFLKRIQDSGFMANYKLPISANSLVLSGQSGYEFLFLSLSFKGTRQIFFEHEVSEVREEVAVL